MPLARQSAFIDRDDPPHPAHVADTVMRFSLWWRHPGDKTEIKETYEKETSNPEQWSRDIIDWFNSTLRPHERPREFVRCEVEGEVPPAEHKWFKVTAMTKANQYGTPYDGMKCERCGITGKRFGMGPHVKIDSKYRLKKFQRCDTAVKAMAESR